MRSDIFNLLKKSNINELATRCAAGLTPSHWDEKTPASKNATASCLAPASSGVMMPGLVSQGFSLKKPKNTSIASSELIVLLVMVALCEFLCGNVSLAEQGAAAQIGGKA